MSETNDPPNSNADSDGKDGGDVKENEEEQRQEGAALGNLPGAFSQQAALADDDADNDGAADDDNDEDDDGVIELEGDEEDDPLALLPPYVSKRVEKLHELNDKRDEIMVDYLKERAALEQKYQQLLKPLYSKRADIIGGKMDEEISKESSPNEGETTEEEPEGVPEGDRVAGIPQFWVVAMGNMEVTADLVTEEDVDCLEHLKDITCVDDEDGKGFTLYFHFGPNDYFHDSVLSKRYEVPNLLLSDEPVLQNVTGCKISWKPGRSLTFKEVKKKQRGKGKNAGQIRTVTKKERRDSFFHFFETPKMPSMETMNEDEANQLEEFFDQDYDVAQAFRSHIIPKAVLWFTGQAMEEEANEEEERDANAGGNANRNNPFPPPVAGNENPECQQS